jgi:glycosyltransferase involved in cell wall biosynthesis
MKIVVLTTSYPRHERDYAGRFVADLVEGLRGRGVDVDVVAPGRFRDFGLAYGAGIPNNLRRRPWAVPFMLGSMIRAVRKAARSADLVHAQWLPNGAAAMLSGRPFVVTLQGTDVELARRMPRLARFVLRRARLVICVSTNFAEEARRLGASTVRVVPNPVRIPETVGQEAAPPEVLFVGRLSPEKGVEELASASEGLNLVVVGDGPLRRLVPGTLGFLPREELYERYNRAAVVVCPSRREGFPVVPAEAMAHARPVVGSAVSGLVDLIVDGESGLLVPPRDPVRLRAAIDRLLADEGLRRNLGRAARERVASLCSLERVVEATLDVYAEALGRPT